MAGYGPRRLQGESLTSGEAGRGRIQGSYSEEPQDAVYLGELPRVAAGIVIPPEIERHHADYVRIAADIATLLDQGSEEISLR
jgi:hypothetical protein